MDRLVSRRFYLHCRKFVLEKVWGILLELRRVLVRSQGSY